MQIGNFNFIFVLLFSLNIASYHFYLIDIRT